MKFLIDAHLPKSIGAYFEALGHEALHTSELPEGNASQDEALIVLAMDQAATVITKDSDFYHSFHLHRRPSKLVQVKVGNLRLKAIKALFETQAAQIAALLADHDLVEVYADRLIAV